MFADDAKTYNNIQCDNDCVVLNDNINNIYAWSEKWLMKLNTSKCAVLNISKNVNKALNHSYTFKLSDNSEVMLKQEHCMKDLGVLIDCNLSFSEHIHEKVNVGYKMLGIIKRNFTNLSKEAFLLLYKSMVRSHLEFAASVWNPYKLGLIYEIEKVQKRATKMIDICKGKNYVDRLKILILKKQKKQKKSLKNEILV